MLNRSLKAGTPVRCSRKGSGHLAHHGPEFTDGKVYVLREDYTATGSIYTSVRVVEDDTGNQNGWNAACFVEVSATTWDDNAVEQMLHELLKDATEAKEWVSARSILDKLVLF